MRCADGTLDVSRIRERRTACDSLGRESTAARTRSNTAPMFMGYAVVHPHTKSRSVARRIASLHSYRPVRMPRSQLLDCPQLVVVTLRVGRLRTIRATESSPPRACNNLRENYIWSLRLRVVTLLFDAFRRLASLNSIPQSEQHKGRPAQATRCARDHDQRSAATALGHTPDWTAVSRPQFTDGSRLGKATANLSMAMT